MSNQSRFQSLANSRNSQTSNIPTAQFYGNQQSAASRLYQFAISATQSVNIPPAIRQTQAFNLLREQSLGRMNDPNNTINNNLDQQENSSAVSLFRNRRIGRTEWAYVRQLRSQARASMHPSFRTKTVCEIGCGYCEQSICARGMKAILLADISVRLFGLL
jgi:hypothetical protein